MSIQKLSTIAGANWPGYFPAATGGTETTFVGNGTIGTNGRTYKVHTFTSSGTFTVVAAGTVEYLIVGGGGSGSSGGGGAGGGTADGGAGGSGIVIIRVRT